MNIAKYRYFDIWYQYDDIHISYINNTNAINKNFQQKHGKGIINLNSSLLHVFARSLEHLGYNES